MGHALDRGPTRNMHELDCSEMIQLPRAHGDRPCPLGGYVGPSSPCAHGVKETRQMQEQKRLEKTVAAAMLGGYIGASRPCAALALGSEGW
jgi:hypothetical protein